MTRFKRVFVFSIVALLIVMSNTLVAQGSYSILTGTVTGIHVHGLKKWLEVESAKDKTIFNFRIGHNTRYIPQRYPNAGERVKVEYLTQRGVPVAYSVTILGGPK
jgi:hypothetical protein